jgi:arylsulfatase A-like enzyme
MTQPNILVITTHDTGRHFGCYGAATVNTPNIDALAAQGVRLANMFTVAPICCPSRASMMTGRYPQSHGLMDMFVPPFNWAMHKDERQLSNILRDAGYRTHLFGIQHEVLDVASLGFDRTAQPKAAAETIAEGVCQFLKQDGRGSRPFYAQVGFHETHTPFTWGETPTDDSKGISIPPYLAPCEAMRQTLAEFQGSVRRADQGVGAILRALDETGLAQNTIVVVTTDHGIELPRAKWTLYDPGLEIAMIMRWPARGVAGGRKCDWLLSNVDFLPTVLELAGVPAAQRVQGVSFAHGLTGQAANPPREAVYGMYAKGSQGRCIRTRDFKLIRNFNIDRWYSKPIDITKPWDYWVCPNLELYDLRSDPQEFHNLADEPSYAEVRRSLELRLLSWLKDVDDPILRAPLRTPFYEKSQRDILALEAGDKTE